MKILWSARIRPKDSYFIIALICLACLAGVLLPALPSQSSTFDCKVSTLSMYRHFTNMGFAATPVMGNLNATGERPEDSNHAWLIVNIYGKDIAYDWGHPCFDHQHYEVYPMSLENLRMQISMDNLEGDAK